MSGVSKKKCKNQVSDRSPDHGLQQLQAILTRLNALEGNSFQRANEEDARAVAVQTPPPLSVDGATLARQAGAEPTMQTQPLRAAQTPVPHTPPRPISVSGISNDSLVDVTEKLVSAISSTMTQVRSNIYISNFDPTVNDFDLWCSEVDHVRIINRWDDRECLARIGGCLKGDART